MDRVLQAQSPAKAIAIPAIPSLAHQGSLSPLEAIMARALLDTDDGVYYHPACAPDATGMETVDEDGMTCTKCGQTIEDDDSEDPTTVEEDEEEEGGPA